jgi:hypothetical protein
VRQNRETKRLLHKKLLIVDEPHGDEVQKYTHYEGKQFEWLLHALHRNRNAVLRNGG